MVSDDSEVVRRHLVAMLSELPFVDVVGEARNVAATLETVQRVQPDVVILDIHMPDGSGLQALKHIKRELPETKVIMLTNHANAFYRRACMNAGASFFFDKSTEFERVGDVLSEMKA